MAIAEKLQNIINEKSQQATMTNYGLTSANQINSSTKFIDYPKYIFNAFLEALRTPDTLFTNLPKKSGSGSIISLNDTANAPMRITLSPSELTQDETPTPSSPQAVHTISGSNKVVVCGKNLFDGINKGIFLNWAVDVCGANVGDSGTYIKVNGGNYTISTTGTQERYRVACVINEPSSTTQTAYRGARKDGTSDSVVIDTTGYNYLVVNATDLSKIQIEKGTTATSYEPYISQEAEVDLKSKNLFETLYNPFQQLNYGTITFSKPIEAGTYTLSISNWEASLGNSSSKLEFNYEDSTKLDTYLNNTNNVRTLTFTQKVVSVKIYSNTTNSNSSGGKVIYTDLMLEKGSIATNYVPYYEPIEYCKIGNYEDKFIRTSGKNLLDIKGTSTNSDITMTAQANGIYISGTSSSARTFGFLGNSIDSPTQYFQAITLSDTNAIKLKAGTYTLSYTKNGTGGSIIGYVGDYGARLDASTSITSTPTFTIAEDKYLYIGMYIANGTATNYLLENIQLEKNNEATSFEPYGSNEWYIKKNIGKVVLNGTEDWALGSVFYVLGVLPENAQGVSASKIMSNYFNNNLGGATDNYIALPGTAGSSIRNIWLKATQFETTSDLTTWLSTHNTELYYILATPTYTKIEGTLANQLENVYQKLLSYSGTTNISQVNNDLPFNMSVQAIEG